MRHLSIDIETKSGADITKTGLYRYAQDKDFSILLKQIHLFYHISIHTTTRVVTLI